MKIEKLTLKEWLSELKPYQSDTMLRLIEEYGEEEASQKWLGSNGPETTLGFGGGKGQKIFYDNLKKEFTKFICGDEKYKEDYDKLKAIAPITNKTLISIISAAIGSSLGCAGTLLAPVVVILLYTVGTVSKNAWCEAQNIKS